ncbi:MAG: TIGR02302 family protein [Pseudorhodoplanes sp.]|uniref:TIGR02302 family protein n=1 Tax=Pseudorhodoplanes sp. TaxID=1934341 RepID=UPI003D0C53ED
MPLTDQPMQGSENTTVSPQREVDRLLARGVARARWSILWERVWPPLAACLTVAGLFFALSWLGLWIWLPPLARAAGVVLFALLALAALSPLAMVRMPGVADGLARLDRRSGLPHRPAVALTDRLATNDSDAMTQALWRAHMERALAAARRLKAGWPMPQLSARDPVAIRALVLILCVATFFIAGGDRERRVAAAFNWQGVVTPANYRIDAWVAPPPYTQRPPVILPGLRPGEAARATAPVTVPAGSTLVIRASGATGLDVALRGGIKVDERTDKTDPAAQPSAAGTEEHRFVISERGEVTLRGIGNPVTWTFVAVPDRAPTVALTKDPEPQARGSLMLNYKVEDDYGVSEARAIFALKPQLLDEFGARAGGFTTPRPLFEAPDMPLLLPQARTRNGVGQTLRDLSSHPWAGADVVLTLRALDEGGNEGLSEPFEMRLPERLFTKPMARALIEQRRNLALDAEMKPRVLTALDALAMAPEVFRIEASVYLGLRSIYWQLNRAKSDDSLREVVARLWDMATRIEDGNISDAEAALRAAQEALRQALERGASEEEIKKLTDELRAALDKFLQALAEEMRKNPQIARQMDPNARNLRSQDLKSMIDRLEQLARSGAKDAAQRLLQELQQMLENLQMARPGQQGDQDPDDMMSALDELGNMIREQQQLRDRTFRQGQDQRRERQRGGQQNEQGMGELRQNQQALREQLQKLLEQLRQRGLGQQGDQGQDGMDQLGKAGEAMGEAEGQLGDGNSDGAVGSQGRALEALRRGAQGMAQAMQQQPGMGPGPGQPGRQQGRAQQETDPLGRPMRQGRDYSDDATVKVPGEIDVQRARRILDELRRRFSDPARPQLELDYIERLLKDF